MAVRVDPARSEEARARMLSLAPEGFEEAGTPDAIELVAYADSAGEARIRSAFDDVVTSDVAPGWEDAWRAFHQPVRVGRLWVGPPWERADRSSLAVVIDPGRAFGTGAHATTRLCLELLLDLAPGSLVDLGCGSGVLAIAAARLGFSPVDALDSDPAAVEATRANAAANGVRVRAWRADVRGGVLPAADVALANIEFETVELIGSRVRATTLVTSGYLERDRPGLSGWVHEDRREADGWAADRWRAGGPGG